MDERLKTDLEALFALLVQGESWLVRRQLEARKGHIFAAAEQVLGPRYATLAKAEG